MLLGNYTQLNANVGKGVGGFTNPYQWMKVSDVMLFYSGEASVLGETDKSSFNNGYTPPYSWVTAPKAGGLSAVNGLIGINTFQNINLAGGLNAETLIEGNGDISTATLIGLGVIVSSLTSSNTLNVNISGAVNLAADLVSVGDLNGALGAIIGILADLNGSGELNGNVGSALNAVATLANGGDLVGAIIGSVQMVSSIVGSNSVVSNIIGTWNMQSDITSTSTLVSSLGAIANLVSELINTSSLSISQGALPTNIEADITSASELSPQSLAAAVWNSIAASFNSAGTMGNKLNSASAAGDPWGAILPSTYVSGEAGYILAQIQTLVNELHTIQGLDPNNPATTTQDSVDAGVIHIDITGDGETSTTFTRND